MTEPAPAPTAFAPIDPDIELSPAQTDRLLKEILNELGRARLALRDARRKEAVAEKAWQDKRIPLVMGEACPKPSRSTGVTKEDRETWLIHNATKEYWDFRGAKVVRECAEDYMRMLREQVSVLQSLNANARTSYELTGRHT